MRSLKALGKTDLGAKSKKGILKKLWLILQAYAELLFSSLSLDHEIDN